MASDPYGFPEATPADGPGDAVLALWSGVAALALGAFGPCLCYLPWFLALPLSGMALWYGVRARSSPSTRGPGLEAAANAGLVSGGIGLTLSLLYVGLFLVYLIYFAVLIGMAASGEL